MRQKLCTCVMTGVEFISHDVPFNCDRIHPLCGIGVEQALEGLSWLARDPDRLRSVKDLNRRKGFMRILGIRLGMHYKFLADHVNYKPVEIQTSDAQCNPEAQYALVAEATALRSLVRGYEHLGSDYPRLAFLKDDAWVTFLNTCRDITSELDWEVSIMQKRTAGTLFKVYEVASISLGELETYTARVLTGYADAVPLAGRVFKICIEKLHGLSLQNSHIKSSEDTVEGLLSAFTEHWSVDELFQVGSLVYTMKQDKMLSQGMRQVLKVMEPWCFLMDARKSRQPIKAVVAKPPKSKPLGIKRPRRPL